MMQPQNTPASSNDRGRAAPSGKPSVEAPRPPIIDQQKQGLSGAMKNIAEVKPKRERLPNFTFEPMERTAIIMQLHLLRSGIKFAQERSEAAKKLKIKSPEEMKEMKKSVEAIEADIAYMKEKLLTLDGDEGDAKTIVGGLAKDEKKEIDELRSVYLAGNKLEMLKFSKKEQLYAKRVSEWELAQALLVLEKSRPKDERQFVARPIKILVKELLEKKPKDMTLEMLAQPPRNVNSAPMKVEDALLCVLWNMSHRIQNELKEWFESNASVASKANTNPNSNLKVKEFEAFDVREAEVKSFIKVFCTDDDKATEMFHKALFISQNGILLPNFFTSISEVCRDRYKKAEQLANKDTLPSRTLTNEVKRPLTEEAPGQKEKMKDDFAAFEKLHAQATKPAQRFLMTALDILALQELAGLVVSKKGMPEARQAKIDFQMQYEAKKITSKLTEADNNSLGMESYVVFMNMMVSMGKWDPELKEKFIRMAMGSGFNQKEFDKWMAKWGLDKIVGYRALKPQTQSTFGSRDEVSGWKPQEVKPPSSNGHDPFSLKAREENVDKTVAAEQAVLKGMESEKNIGIVLDLSDLARIPGGLHAELRWQTDLPKELVTKLYSVFTAYHFRSFDEVRARFYQEIDTYCAEHQMPDSIEPARGVFQKLEVIMTSVKVGMMTRRMNFDGALKDVQRTQSEETKSTSAVANRYNQYR